MNIPWYLVCFSVQPVSNIWSLSQTVAQLVINLDLNMYVYGGKWQWTSWLAHNLLYSQLVATVESWMCTQCTAHTHACSLCTNVVIHTIWHVTLVAAYNRWCTVHGIAITVHIHELVVIQSNNHTQPYVLSHVYMRCINYVMAQYAPWGVLNTPCINIIWCVLNTS